jgi:transcriptional regulator with XRE-family HTH domain
MRRHSEFSPEKLTKLRRARDLSTTQLGARLDRTAYAVATWERGVATPPTKLLPALADELGVEIADPFEEVRDEVLVTQTKER